MKNVLACLSAKKDGESSFLHCGGPVKLVQTCLCAGNNIQRRFHRRGSAVEHVQASLSASKDQGSSSLLCGSPVKLVQTCLCAENAVLTAEEVL